MEAIALAAHGYVRFTDDLDLGVNTDPNTLHRVVLAPAPFARFDDPGPGLPVPREPDVRLGHPWPRLSPRRLRFALRAALTGEAGSRSTGTPGPAFLWWWVRAWAAFPVTPR